MPDVEYVGLYEPTATKGGSASSPASLAIDLGQVWLWRMEVRIPPGHAGLTGIALVDSGAFVVPYSGSTPAWLIGDDDLLTYPYGKQIGASAALYFYNTSTDYDHSWQVRLIYTPMSAKGNDTAEIISPAPANWLAELGTAAG